MNDGVRRFFDFISDPRTYRVIEACMQAKDELPDDYIPASDGWEMFFNKVKEILEQQSQA